MKSAHVHSAEGRRGKPLAEERPLRRDPDASWKPIRTERHLMEHLESNRFDQRCADLESQCGQGISGPSAGCSTWWLGHDQVSTWSEERRPALRRHGGRPKASCDDEILRPAQLASAGLLRTGCNDSHPVL